MRGDWTAISSGFTTGNRPTTRDVTSVVFPAPFGPPIT
jgi:hypothetical protein